jgi:phage terminase small subunit
VKDFVEYWWLRRADRILYEEARWHEQELAKIKRRLGLTPASRKRLGIIDRRKDDLE